MNRREFLRSLAVTGALVAVATVGIVELGDLVSNGEKPVSPLPPGQPVVNPTISRSGGANSTATVQSISTEISSGYFLVASMSQLSGKSYAYFTHPNFGNSILVYASAQWRAFSATCTHRPCTVQYESSEIYCPCHAGVFSPIDGTVEGGPPPSPLPEYAVLIQGDSLYVGNSRIN